MDIKKYITNKDITITNDDLDIEKLENDLRKGYELSSGVNEKIKSAVDEANSISKADYEKLKEENTTLQNSITDYEKRNTDLASRIKTVSLERTMVEHGFTKDQFEEVSKMRSSLFENEKDDDKAISQIKEKFKGTYFPTKTEAPKTEKDDLPIGGAVKPPEALKVTRLTNIRDIIKK